MTTQPTFEERVSTWTGRLIVSIGEGKFRESIAALISCISAESFESGVQSGKAAAKSDRAKEHLR